MQQGQSEQSYQGYTTQQYQQNQNYEQWQGQGVSAWNNTNQRGKDVHQKLDFIGQSNMTLVG